MGRPLNESSEIEYSPLRKPSSPVAPLNSMEQPFFLFLFFDFFQLKDFPLERGEGEGEGWHNKKKPVLSRHTGHVSVTESLYTAHRSQDWHPRTDPQYESLLHSSWDWQRSVAFFFIYLFFYFLFPPPPPALCATTHAHQKHIFFLINRMQPWCWHPGSMLHPPK